MCKGLPVKNQTVLRLVTKLLESVWFTKTKQKLAEIVANARAQLSAHELASEKFQPTSQCLRFELVRLSEAMQDLTRIWTARS